VLQIKQDVNAASDHSIDIVVETQDPKPSEADIKDAKSAFREISSTLLGLLTLSSLAEKRVPRFWIKESMRLGRLCRRRSMN
jgi:hypothetical protein